MYSKSSFAKGFLKNLFNPRVSILSFVGSDCVIDKKATIHRWAKIKRGTIIGAYTYVSNDTILDNATVGNFCSIADHCRIGLPSHNPRLLSTSPIFTIKNNAAKMSWVTEDIDDFESKRTIIGNDVWIASHVLIMGGLIIVALVGVIVALALNLTRGREAEEEPQQSRAVLVTEENVEQIVEEAVSVPKVRPGNYETVMNLTWRFPDGESPSSNAYGSRLLE